MNNIALSKIFFLDIETVPQYPNYEHLPEKWKNLWNKKANSLKFDDPDQAYQRAGIYAEFGKIICIGLGVISLKDDKKTARIKTYYSDNEVVLLQKFNEFIDKNFTSNNYLCAHNGREFDFPYIARRLLINNLPIPSILDVNNLKQWEIQLLDTMQMWRFGDYKAYTSLELLCACFDIDSPKDDIDGSQVWSVYWVDKDLERIARYCSQDVYALIQLYLHLTGNGKLDDVVFL